MITLTISSAANEITFPFPLFFHELIMAIAHSLLFLFTHSRLKLCVPAGFLLISESEAV